MFGANPVPVSIPCARCSAPPAIVVFRHYHTVTLFCRGCEYPWAVDVADFPELAAIKAEAPRGTATPESADQ